MCVIYLIHTMDLRHEICVLDYYFRQRATLQYFRSGFISYASLTLLSVSCCWAEIRMLAADWLNLYVAPEQPFTFLSF